MRSLSKTKLLAYRQCHKRLWLEVKHPELREESAETAASFQEGDNVGQIALSIYDPRGVGAFVDRQKLGINGALAFSEELMLSRQPIFEAGLSAGGACCFTDVMLPSRKGGGRRWRIVEVKASASIKDYQRDDVALQAFVTKSAGVEFSSISLAHVDSSWVYQGDGNYHGLLVEHDLTEETRSREEEVKGWISGAQAIVRRRTEPKIQMGAQCTRPYACGFSAHCQKSGVRASYPLDWLPKNNRKALNSYIDTYGITDMQEVPDDLLNDQQLRVKRHTLSGEPFFDSESAACDLASHRLPAYFLDFETIRFAVPIWKGTRPYQNICFQFSVHHLSRTGKLQQAKYIDLSGKDPSKKLAEALIAACVGRGPVFVYNATFEKSRIKELADRFPTLKRSLVAIIDRIVDLLPIAEKCYYHPQQQGSWSMKRVLPAIAPDLCYDTLEGVHDGGMAMDAYREAIAPRTSARRKFEIERQLLEYCRLDTYGMIRIWQKFSGRTDLRL